jgi:cytochrome oxidase Cu insertion factor (SCO1/SenC/PrrC family)
MVDLVKNFNSKRFLITYLVIVILMLLMLSQRFDMVVPEKREIPDEMKSYLVSPIRLIPEFTLLTTEQKVITEHYFEDKWSFVYFSYSGCLPGCSSALNKIQELKRSFGDRLFNFLIIDIDDLETPDKFKQMLTFHGYDDVTIASADKDTIEKLARAFIALYLKTEFANDEYIIEQEHLLFAVDPQGRVYAKFKPPYSDLQSQFLRARSFYAQTEQ